MHKTNNFSRCYILGAYLFYKRHFSGWVDVNTSSPPSIWPHPRGGLSFLRASSGMQMIPISVGCTDRYFLETYNLDSWQQSILRIRAKTVVPTYLPGGCWQWTRRHSDYDCHPIPVFQWMWSSFPVQLEKLSWTSWGCYCAGGDECHHGALKHSHL